MNLLAPASRSPQVMASVSDPGMRRVTCMFSPRVLSAAVAIAALIGCACVSARYPLSGTDPRPYQVGGSCDSEFRGSIACGDTFFSIRGTFAFSGPDGQPRAVTRVRFCRGYYNGTSFEGALTCENTAVDRRGRFIVQVTVPFSSVDLCQDGIIVTRTTHYTNYYLVSAQGCDDLIVPVTKNWSDKQLLMTCPGRSQ
jgi:hypothetical protein